MDRDANPRAPTIAGLWVKVREHHPTDGYEIDYATSPLNAGDSGDPNLGWIPLDTWKQTTFIPALEIKEALCRTLKLGASIPGIAASGEYADLSPDDSSNPWADGDIVDISNIGKTKSRPVVLVIKTNYYSNVFDDGSKQFRANLDEDNESESDLKDYDWRSDKRDSEIDSRSGGLSDDDDDDPAEPDPGFTTRIQPTSSSDWYGISGYLSRLFEGEILWTDGELHSTPGKGTELAAISVIVTPRHFMLLDGGFYYQAERRDDDGRVAERGAVDYNFVVPLGKDF
ncbi:hypothetical protein GALMADRAFT_141255 [Galerina marginata CBS 339.88]|uniref:Uncharacterized protein n=1 Tax=Galerina marginata (strain CBS 339.88) TaxID=685588 RepID=A0A067T7L2_GALM3|nr:hypothetical protein GALMADRAFT_141255 [Galerina marginata CBS 339.88]